MYWAAITTPSKQIQIEIILKTKHEIFNIFNVEFLRHSEDKREKERERVSREDVEVDAELDISNLGTFE